MSEPTRIQAVHADAYTGDAQPRIVWTANGDDLHVNLIALGPGEEIGEHVNAQLDVLQACLDGDGTLTVDGEALPFGAGSVVLVPKGVARSTRAGEAGLRYVTCHRRRGGLMPTVQRRS
ncbi:MAG TPA: cupin domain-containing protein [Thermomicrobiales bacterium]|nr:cupin domain-containing protein [Thermomicrobiales bacterium]